MNASVRSTMNYSELRIMNNRRRRNQELKRNIIIFLISFVLFIVLSVLLFSTKSIASDGSEVALYKYYKSVEINSGDTLNKLSNDYLTDGYKSSEDLMKEIMFINNLSFSDVLLSGSYIVIPYYAPYIG